jgi:hypothetical protein
MTVVIGTEATAPEGVAHPRYLAPVKFMSGQPIERVPFAPTEDERWQRGGSASIMISQGSQRVVVYPGRGLPESKCLTTSQPKSMRP